MADTGGIIATVVAAVMGGGGIGAVISAWRARKVVPAERDSIIVTGAESAVESLQKALEQSDKRVAALEQENATLRATVEQLRRDVEAAQASVRDLTTSLATTKAELDRLLDTKH